MMGSSFQFSSDKSRCFEMKTSGGSSLESDPCTIPSFRLNE
jgi:hypothetical protein